MGPLPRTCTVTPTFRLLRLQKPVPKGLELMVTLGSELPLQGSRRTAPGRLQHLVPRGLQGSQPTHSPTVPPRWAHYALGKEHGLEKRQGPHRHPPGGGGPSEVKCAGSSPDSLSSLCDLREVTEPLCASISKMRELNELMLVKNVEC